MVQTKNMSILIVIAVAAAILHNTEAADYIVGGSTGWRNSPPGGDSFYSNWADNITFRVNDVLVFNFVTGSHSVAEITKANFDSCDVSQSIQVLVTSPARVTLNRTGEFYFSCSFQGHCGSGQKLSVNVIGSSPPPTQSPAPRSPSPSPPRSASPPPQTASPPRSASPPPQTASPPTPTPAQGPSPPVSGTTPISPPSNEAAPPTTDAAGATPPSPGSATTLIATYSLLLATVVINILF